MSAPSCSKQQRSQRQIDAPEEVHLYGTTYSILWMHCAHMEVCAQAKLESMCVFCLVQQHWVCLVCLCLIFHIYVSRDSGLASNSVLVHVTDTCRRRVQLVTAWTPPPLLFPPSLHSGSLSLSPPFPVPLTFSISRGVPLPPLLDSLPEPGLGAKAQAVPCRDHMDSSVLLSRARNVVPTSWV